LLGTSRQASRSGQTGAGTHCCKASEPYGVKPVPRGRRARFSRTNEEQSSRNELSAKRWNAPRSPAAAAPFAGSCGTEDLSGWRIAFARYVIPVRAGNAEGAQPSSSRATHARQRGARSVRGGDSRRRKSREPSLGPAGPRSPCVLGCMWISWLVACVGSQGSAKGERR